MKPIKDFNKAFEHAVSKKQCDIHSVVGRSEQFYCVGHESNPCEDVNNQCNHCQLIEDFWKQ
jgi:hypothetical protein